MQALKNKVESGLRNTSSKQNLLPLGKVVYKLLTEIEKVVSCLHH